MDKTLLQYYKNVKSLVDKNLYSKFLFVSLLSDMYLLLIPPNHLKRRWENALKILH